MADFYEHFTITPASIPIEVVSAELLDELVEAGVSVDELPQTAEESRQCIYLYGEYHFDQETLPPLLQRLVQEAAREIESLVVEGAQLCTRLLPESHGGFALVITATEIRECWTAAWIQHTLTDLTGDTQATGEERVEEDDPLEEFDEEVLSAE
ncbi:MAG: hypothetical protein DWQ07_17690 [Chloroflexi bacterium]|nr:MAG: hypothetical protein DWQ07_17690 [Chloroflexota bacterium]